MEFRSDNQRSEWREEDRGVEEEGENDRIWSDARDKVDGTFIYYRRATIGYSVLLISRNKQENCI